MTDRSARSHVYVGAAQSKAGTLAGVFRRAAGEDRWERLTKGLPEATSVQAITVHPTNPDVVYLGTRAGAYRSLDRSEEHTSELQSRGHLVCRLLLEKKNQ